jgi:hypothetical protein
MYLNQSISQSISQSINQPISHPIQESTNMDPIVWTVITSDTATFSDFMEFMDNYEDRTWQEVFETIPMGFFKIFMEFAIKNNISITQIRTMVAYMNFSNYPWLEYRNEFKDFYEVLHHEDAFEYIHKDAVIEDMYGYIRPNTGTMPNEVFANNIIDVIYYVRVHLNKTDTIVEGDTSWVQLLDNIMPLYPLWLEIKNTYFEQVPPVSPSSVETTDYQFEDEIDAWFAMHPPQIQHPPPFVIEDDATTVSMSSVSMSSVYEDEDEYVGGWGG